MDQFRYSHDGLTCGTGVKMALPLKNRGLRHYGRQYSDEHPGTVYRAATRAARTAVNLANRYSGSGEAVAVT